MFKNYKILIEDLSDYSVAYDNIMLICGRTFRIQDASKRRYEFNEKDY